MPELYLRKTVGSWSAGTAVMFVEDLPGDKILVSVISGDKSLDEQLKRKRLLELTKEDLVVRKRNESSRR